MKKILKAALRQCFILNIVLEFSRCKIFWINSLMNRNSRHGRLERRKGKEFWVLIHHPNLANMCAYCACCHFSCVWLFETLWTVACQAPLFMECSRQEYWSHSLLKGILLTQELNMGLLPCRWILYRLSHQGSPCLPYSTLNIKSMICPSARNWLGTNEVCSFLFFPTNSEKGSSNHT